MSTEQSSTRAVVAQAYAALNAGDVAAFLAVLADDVVLHEAEGAPTSGVFHGKAAIVEAFPHLASGYGLRGVVLHHLIVDGDRAVGLIDILCTSKSGAEFTMPTAESWLVRDGKAVEIRPYLWDTAAFAKYGN